MNVKGIKVETIFLILSLFFGLLILTLNPPFQVPDESEHYDKSYAISEGNILTGNIIKLPKSVMEIKKEFPMGDFDPGKMSKMMPNNTNTKDPSNLQRNDTHIGDFDPTKTPNNTNTKDPPNFQPNKNDFRGNRSDGGFGGGFSKNSNQEEYKKAHDLIKSYIFKPLNPEDVEEQNISTISSYPPASYIGSASGMFVGKLFNCSALMLLYIGRLVNLLIYVLCIYSAIKIIPIKKYVLLLFGLMPTTLFLGASLSADSLTIAVSFLIIAYFFKLSLVNEQIRRRDILILSTLTVFLILSKQIYAGLALLFFMIPKSRFTNIKERLVCLMAVFTPAIVVELLYSMAMKYVGNGYSISLIRDNFSIVGFLFNVFNALKSSLLTRIIPGTIGSIGFHLNHPIALTYIFLLVVVLTTLFDYSKYRLNLRIKTISLATFVLLSLVIFQMVSNWSSHFGDQNSLFGLQPRYFVPIILLPFMLINMKTFNRIKLSEKCSGLPTTFLIAFMVSTLAITIYSLYTGMSLF
jgi:uncharacterized membrane protein